MSTEACGKLKMFIIRFIAVFLLGVLAYQPVLSQTLPSCRSLASDVDGDGYGWENDSSCVITSTSLAKPTFTNLETGKPVDLIRARWNPSDFGYVVCEVRQFDGTSYRIPTPRTSGLSIGYDFEPLPGTAPYNGNVIVFGTPNVTRTWTLDNGIYYGPSDLSTSPWLEIIDIDRSAYGATTTANAVRVWLTDTQYTECFTPNPYARFAPTGSATDDGEGNCDYSNASIYDGWGWNPVAGTSCEPVNAGPTDNCDYSNAGMFDGWGWDATTGQSCKPVGAPYDISEDPNCDYTNAPINQDWGWNPITGRSCPPL